MSYKHGAYGEMLDTKTEIAFKALGTVPIYFGTAPIGQINGFDKTNKPILIESFKDAQALIGYSENFSKYTLCEAVYAHFKNAIKPIAPIVVINSLDVTSHKATAQTTKELNFVNKIARFEDEDIILSSFSIEGKVFGSDYFVSIEADGKTVIVTDIKGQFAASTPCKYNCLDLKKHTEKEIVVGITKGLPLVYQNLNLIPTVLAAPGWSDKTLVNEALLLSSQKINGHWYAWVNSDILADSNAGTIEKAIEYKKTNSRNSPRQFVCYPIASKGDRMFHMSTLVTVAMQQVDSDNEGIPYEEPSNKNIDIDGLRLLDKKSLEFDMTEANKLNAQGIVTAIFWGGKWVLWGVNTAAYEDGVPIDPKNIFSSSVRMMQYIANEFQRRNGLIVDKPMNRNLKDKILNDSGEFLDALTAQGALLGGNVLFDQKSNSESDIVMGDFVFDIKTTTTPPMKSATFKIGYTSEWQSVLFDLE